MQARIPSYAIILFSRIWNRYGSEAYLGSCQTSMMELFCEEIESLKRFIDLSASLVLTFQKNILFT